MGKAGYLTTIKKGGTPTAFTGEIASLVPGTTATYQINDVTKRIWNRAVEPEVYDGGDLVTPVAIDYLFGRVTLAEPAAGVVTIDGNYLPTVVVAKAHGYRLNCGGTIHDRTDYENAQASNGSRSRSYGLLDAEATITRFDDLSKDFSDLLAARTPLLVEIRPGGSGDYFRGWMIPASDNRSGAVDDLEQDELSFQLEGNRESACSWGQ